MKISSDGLETPNVKTRATRGKRNGSLRVVSEETTRTVGAGLQTTTEMAWETMCGKAQNFLEMLVIRVIFQVSTCTT